MINAQTHNEMKTLQKKQHEDFKAAKQLALNMTPGCYQRRGNYKGFKSNSGRMFVIGDTNQDLQNPDATINGCPAREVFGDFTIMKS